MQIEADIATMEINGGRMRIHHGDESAHFMFLTFKRTAFEGNNEVFNDINKYWSQQPENIQYEIFRIYKRIEDYLEDILTKEDLAQRLKQAVKELYDLHPFQTIRNWMINEGTLTVPPVFKKQYVADPDRNTSIEKTYLYDDYRDLMALSLILRLMVPIWASYVRMMRSHAGNGLKELEAFKLLELTEIPRLEAMEKLHTYIRANIRKENASVVPVNLISEYDQPYWVLSLICVRKICVGDLRPNDPHANLVTLVSNFIKIKTTYNDGDFANRLNIRGNSEGSGASEESKISTMESVRTNTEISIGEAVELGFAVRDIRKVAARCFPNMPIALLENALSTVNNKASQEAGMNRMLPPQRMLMAWVLKKAIPPLGVDFLEAEDQLKCMALTQAALWYKGHHYLALLSTAYATKNTESVHMVSSTVGRSRVSEAQVNELRRWYPFVRVTESRKAPAKESCFVMNDIDAACVDLSSSIWRATASDDLYRQALGETHNKQIQILPEIRIKILDLAIDIGSRKFFE